MTMPSIASPLTPSRWCHSAFYRFKPLADPAAAAARLNHWAHDHGLTGMVLLASTGVNGGVAGDRVVVDAFEAQLIQLIWGQDSTIGDDTSPPQRFARTQCHEPPHAPYTRWRVHVRRGLVALGDLDFEASAQLPSPDQTLSSAVKPEAWDDLIRSDQVIVLDNRNHFEYELGRFEGASSPHAHTFKDFAQHVLAMAPHWREQGKTVAMYCTGGIRCERLAPWMMELGLKVRQLDGGILGYLAHQETKTKDACPMPPRSSWLGDCYVFDKRVALNAELAPSGIDIETALGRDPAQAWRLQRARRLEGAAPESSE